MGAGMMLGESFVSDLCHGRNWRREREKERFGWMW